MTSNLVLWVLAAGEALLVCYLMRAAATRRPAPVRVRRRAARRPRR